MLNIPLSKMLRSMVPLIDPSEDFFNIAAAEEQMGEVADERRKEMDAMNAKLKGVAPSSWLSLLLVPTHFFARPTQQAGSRPRRLHTSTKYSDTRGPRRNHQRA